ncbi:MAG: hypothetical protein U0527_15105 [Candidatus Eisenbacteria bacterium]
MPGRALLAVFVAIAFLLVALADLAHHLHDRDCDSGHPDNSHSCLLYRPSPPLDRHG